MHFHCCTLWLAAGLLVAAAPPLGAQVDISKPIPIKEAKSKLEKFRGEVLNVTNVAITVRSQENERLIRTFTYSPQVREKIQQIIEQGGYQHGDKVEIGHKPGSDVALRIKGRPSKPL